MSGPQLPVLEPEGRVLSTLESDGSRRWLRPRLSQGRFWHRRRVLAYALIAVYTLLPFVEIAGRPALQIDLWHARFSLFGLLLTPTELHLVAFFALAAGLSIFFATAIVGRVWCGWGCPQTVYLEYVFRPIERFFTGTAGKGGAPKKPVAPWRTIALYGVYLLICWHLANTFLAYFVGAKQLHHWIWTAPPWEHPGAFLLVAFVTGLMMFDFCYWREQLCIIGCPYGRFQSVMLDRSSLIVGYDQRRGEPRGRGRDREAKGLGDCVNCGMCVEVCPTGIDIRDGLQMECVNCTQCIDACDAVMDKVGAPRGLIRYSSQSGLEGQPTRIVRPRVLIYSAVILLVSAILASQLIGRSPFDVTLLRGMGKPYMMRQDGDVANIVRLRIANRTDEDLTCRVEMIEPAEVRLDGEVQFTAEPQQLIDETLYLVATPEAFVRANGMIEVRLRFIDAAGATLERDYRLFGPASAENANLQQGDQAP